jgi:hypothetical protein
MFLDNIRTTDFELRGYIYIRKDTKQGGECGPSHTSLTDTLTYICFGVEPELMDRW